MGSFKPKHTELIQRMTDIGAQHMGYSQIVSGLILIKDFLKWAEGVSVERVHSDFYQIGFGNIFFAVPKKAVKIYTIAQHNDHSPKEGIAERFTNSLSGWVELKKPVEPKEISFNNKFRVIIHLELEGNFIEAQDISNIRSSRIKHEITYLLLSK